MAVLRCMPRMLHDLAVEPGQHVAQIGAGAGYYTAMLAELVGPSGRVSAFEFDPELAARARANLAPWRNVTVYRGGWRRRTRRDGRPHLRQLRRRGAGGVLDRAPQSRRALALCARRAASRRAREVSASRRQGRRGADRSQAATASPLHTATRPIMSAPKEDWPGTRIPSSLCLLHSSGAASNSSSPCGGTAVDPMRCWYWTARWSLSYDPLDDAT